MKTNNRNLILVVFLFGPFLISCGKGVTADSLLNNNGNQSLLSSSPLQDKALQIIANNCTACHGSTSGSGNVFALTSVSHLISSGLVSPGLPDQSPLLLSIEAGRMPPSGALSSQDQKLLRDWIASGAAAPAQPPTTLPPVSAPPTQTPGTVEDKAVAILQTHCYSCHGGNNVAGGLGDVTNPIALAGSGWLVPGNATSSTIYDAIAKSRMPPAGKLNQADITIIADWINQGAKSPASLPPPPPTIPLAGNFQSININILQPKCVACHSATVAKDGVRLDTYSAVLKYIKVGNANSSKLFEVSQDGSMPPKPNPQLGDAEMKAMSDWINAGAANN